MARVWVIGLFLAGCFGAGPDVEPEPVCGDGELAGDEQCDDGNALDGDGCQADCTLSCGNGVVDAVEVCDDSNADPGDGCDQECEVEFGHFFEIEPNDAGANQPGVFEGSLVIHGSLSSLDSDKFLFINEGDLSASVSFETFSPGTGESCGDATRIGVVVSGASIAPGPVVGDPGTGQGGCSRIDEIIVPPNSEIFDVVVSAEGDSAVDSYRLVVSYQ
jgi:cysteine-rich repeat protein